MAKLKLAGSRFTEIKGNRKPDFSGNLNMKTNINIEDFEKTKESIKVTYSFEITYGELGKIELKGLLFLTSDNKTLRELQKAWKSKKLDTEEFIAITNVVMQKASVKALEIEEELGLPIHLRMPTFNPKK